MHSNNLNRYASRLWLLLRSASITGTNSVRALVVDAKNGAELASCVVDYPSGKQGVLLDARDHHLARQHPGDYLFGLEKSVTGAIRAAKKKRGFDAKNVVGIGVDTTGSSPLPVDKTNRPLGLQGKWRKNLAAQCWLWKDHTSHREAAEITRMAALHRPAVHREVREHVLVGVVLVENLALPQGRAGCFQRRRELGGIC